MLLNIASLEPRKTEWRRVTGSKGEESSQLEQVEPQSKKLNFHLDGNSQPRDSHLTAKSRDIFIMGDFAADGRKMTSADV